MFNIKLLLFFFKKIRKALLKSRDKIPLNRVCEINGAYVNHYVRPVNNANNRINRRLAVNQNPNKRCIVVVRQKHDGETKYIGSRRTLTYVLHNENPIDIMNIANNRIVKETEIHADEANAYGNLHTRYDTQRANHSVNM